MGGSCCTVAVTGILGCRWSASTRSTEKTKLVEWLAFAFLVVVLLLNFILLYIWIVGENGSHRLNWGFWDSTGSELDLYSIILGGCILIFSLTFVITMLAVLHFILNQQLFIEWFYKVVNFIFLLYALMMFGLIQLFYPDGWDHVPLSMKFLAAFFQICAVVVMTFVTWPVAGGFAVLKRRGRTLFCYIGIVLYCAFLLALYLSPLGINSPCVLDELPQKPLVLAHRGAEELAPENTLISFEMAADVCEAFGIESDVRISYDGVPYVFHDDILTRTTNVQTVFPQNTSQEADFFTMSDLKKLDAGSWFLEEDPFHKASTISPEMRNVYRNQTIPTLQEMLNLATSYNMAVMVDLRKPLETHPYNSTWFDIALQAFRDVTVSNTDLHYWFGSDGNALVVLVKNFTYDSIVNEYINIPFSSIKRNNEENIWTNVWGVNMDWVYSQYWCAATPSVTTDSCSDFKSLKAPLWVLTPKQYLTIWLVFDCVSVFWVIIIFIVQFRRGRKQWQKSDRGESELRSQYT